MVRTRGQLLLIGAVLIGMTIVGTVVLLNGMQYADSAGTQSQSQVLDNAELTEQMVERDIDRLTEIILAENPASSKAKTYLGRNVSAYNNQTRNMTLDSSAGVVNVTYNHSATEGQKMERTTRQRFAPPASSQPLVNDVEYLRSFEVTVETFAGSATGPSNSVDIIAKNQSGDRVWKLEAYVDGTGDGNVRVTTPAGTEGPCNVGTPPITIEVIEGENAGGGCSFTGIREGKGTPTSISFEQYNNAEGTYRILVDGSPQVSSTGYPVRPGIDIRYRSSELSYNRTIQVEDPEAPPR